MIFCGPVAQLERAPVCERGDVGGFPEIASGKKRLLITGQFSYDDVFGSHHAFAVQAIYDAKHHNCDE